MINLPASSLTPNFNKSDFDNMRKVKLFKENEAKTERIQKLTNDIISLNNKISDLSFIESQSAENIKSMLIFRLQLISEKNQLLK